jgi:hypothetical protein
MHYYMRGQKGPLIVLEYPGGRGGGMNSKWYQEQVASKCIYNMMRAERGQVPF